MKKRFIALLLALLLIPAYALCAGTGKGFVQRLQYGEMVSYENAVYGYSLEIFEKFIMYPDDVLRQIGEDMASEQEEGDDELYDFRYWISPDSNYLFQVQVKEQTYDSFETEVAMAPEYLSIVRADMEEGGYENIEQLHAGVLRDTPGGQMLETAIAFDMTLDDGQRSHVVSLYYDCYYEDIEYIFQMTAYDQTYEDAQSLLDAIVQTVRIIPGDKLV